MPNINIDLTEFDTDDLIDALSYKKLYCNDVRDIVAVFAKQKFCIDTSELNIEDFTLPQAEAWQIILEKFKQKDPYEMMEFFR